MRILNGTIPKAPKGHHKPYLPTLGSKLGAVVDGKDPAWPSIYHVTKCPVLWCTRSCRLHIIHSIPTGFLYPNTNGGIRSRILYLKWCLRPHTTIFRYLDPLGFMYLEPYRGMRNPASATSRCRGRPSLWRSRRACPFRGGSKSFMVLCGFQLMCLDCGKGLSNCQCDGPRLYLRYASI